MVLCAGCLFAVTGCDGGESDDSSDGGTDGESDGGSYTLWNCPTSPSSIDDFAPYRDPGSVEEIRATIYAEVSSRIETAQLFPCADPGDWDDCVEGSCTAADGAQVEYRLASGTSTAIIGDEFWITTTASEETAHISLPEGAEAWSALDWSETHNIEDNGVDLYSDEIREFSAAWTGSLAADWPTDFALEGQVSEYDSWAGYGNDNSAQLSHALCDFDVAAGRDDWVGEYVYITIYDHHLICTYDEIEGGYCTIDGECVGVMDIDDWEIIDDCE